MTKDTNEDITTVKMSYIPVTGNKIIRCIDQLEYKMTPDITGFTTNLLKNV
jgi:hypothetical protein